MSARRVKVKPTTTTKQHMWWESRAGGSSAHFDYGTNGGDEEACTVEEMHEYFREARESNAMPKSGFGRTNLASFK